MMKISREGPGQEIISYEELAPGEDQKEVYQVKGTEQRSITGYIGLQRTSFAFWRGWSFLLFAGLYGGR